VRPALHPALRRLWRDPHTLQLGLDPAVAVVLSNLDPGSVRLLSLLDGSRDTDLLVRTATAEGFDPSAVRRLLDGLAASGLLTDAADDLSPAGQPTARADDCAVRARLGPDAASLALLARGGGGRRARNVLASRRRARVAVYGAGRIGTPLAALLAASGVGALSLLAAGVSLASDAAPGGLQPADEGRSRLLAGRDAVRRAAPEVDLDPSPDPGTPDLAVVAGTAPLDPRLRQRLHAAGTPHLLAGVRETTGIVGPLVVPGGTSCLRCADLHRTERDPAWPVLAAQLARAGDGPGACDSALAAVVVGHAAQQALTFLDSGHAAAVEGSLEVTLPDWRIRRRSWPAHPLCDCGASPPIGEQPSLAGGTMRG